jgi:hypothetical protein
VELFNNQSSDAFPQIGRLYNDQVFDLGLASLVIEIVTYNPNYAVVMVTQVTFDCTDSGTVIPDSSTRGFRYNHYDF